jgi:D-alanyl-lipoteichoic acid acyltransferase DltB (MBOAT superfamily)
MTIVQISILALVAIVIGRLPKGRELALLAVSTFVVFWLQPVLPIVSLGYWLPFATLSVTVLAWVLTSVPEARGLKQNWPAIAVLLGVAVLMEANRYFKLEQVYIIDTPRVYLVVIALIVIAAAAFILSRWQKANRFLLVASFTAIILIFVFLKSEVLMKMALDYIARIHPSSPDNTLTSLSWLGFSYLAFRIMHTIRDRLSGRLPAVTLGEYVNYVIFFPSFTAGPIDRIERFIKELRTPLALNNEDWIDAGTRFFVGLFKKFVIADLLAVISLSDVLVSQVKTSGWMWLFLYAYAFRIYFDFSGYTDIAIGLGRVIGIRLPENFSAPYLKSNLTQFWNSWHMTLTQWFRSYFFNPVTRAIRSSKNPWPIWLTILVTQVSTMVLIGMWHGITLNFALWGAWHGLGLFIQNRWSEFIRNRLPAWAQTRNGQVTLNIAGIFLTFNFVALGWLFFNLSTPQIAVQALLKLFGLA